MLKKAALLFVRSSTCRDGNCVEAAITIEGNVLVRDSKNLDQQTLSFTTSEWEAFLTGVAAGEFAVDRLPVLTTTS